MRVMPRSVTFSGALFLLFMVLFLDPVTTWANPGFARKFGYSCNMCHNGFPKLNPFGEEFARNGYQLPGGNDTGDSQSYDDPKLSLEKSLNLAVRVDSYLRYRSDTSVRSDIASPFLAKLFIVGYLGKDVTFYSYFLANEGGRVVGFEDAFLYLTRLGGTGANLQIGQFQVMDPVYSREQRLTYQDIEIYLTRVGKSNFELTYQRGATLFYGYKLFDVVVGVVNGNGIGNQNSNGSFDNNNPKDLMGRVGFSSGPVVAGLFGYLGREKDDTTGMSQRLVRYGPDLRVRDWITGLDLRAQWLYGRNDNPDFLTIAQGARLSGGFVELDYHFNADWTGIFLYNSVNSPDRPELGKRLATLNLTHYFKRNLKGLIEYTHDLKSVSPYHMEKTHVAVLGLAFAF